MISATRLAGARDADRGVYELDSIPCLCAAAKMDPCAMTRLLWNAALCQRGITAIKYAQVARESNATDDDDDDKGVRASGRYGLIDLWKPMK